MSEDMNPQRIPTPNAATVLSRGQVVTLVVAALLLVAALWLNAHRTILILNVAFIVFYLAFCHYRLVLEFLSLHTARQPFDPAAVPPGGWPSYTILVPLYREETAVPGLMAHLRRLDYPADRIQILLLVEEDDRQTRAAVARAGVAPPFEEVKPNLAQQVQQQNLKKQVDDLKAKAKIEIVGAPGEAKSGAGAAPGAK
jgi:cellulose synthase/poly-beta-1,6-N-acetylglucosamine synthase-like glycosyltransferase